MNKNKILNEYKERQKLLLGKFAPQILNLAVNFINFDSTVLELRNYLMEHKDFRPDQRELFQTLLKKDGTEVRDLVVLSKNIAMNGYYLDDSTPLS